MKILKKNDQVNCFIMSKLIKKYFFIGLSSHYTKYHHINMSYELREITKVLKFAKKLIGLEENVTIDSGIFEHKIFDKNHAN